MDLLTWTMRRRLMLKPGGPFDLSRHLYLRDIYLEQAKKIVIYKASQMGASEYAISYAMHAADARQCTVLYVFPTDTHVSDFSTARIGPAIEASPYLESIVIEAGGPAVRGRKVRGADRVTLKRVRNRFLYLRGAQVKPSGQAPQLKSIDADVLVLDEVDEMDPRAPSIAVKRLGHSLIADERWISTPTYPGFGIHAAWGESDQREWHIRCEHCWTWQPLTIHQVVIEFDGLGRPTAWHGQGEGRAWAACVKCGKEVDHLSPGRWVASYPERDVVGYHLTKLFSPTTALIDIVHNLQTTDETKRREAFNQDLGEPYLPKGGQLDDVTLDACKRNYAHGPVAGERCTLGADVNKLINVVIRGERDKETGEWPQRYAGEVESFEALGRLLKQYNVYSAVIDALPETRKARELQGDFPAGVVWLAYYVNQKIGTKRAEEIQWDDNEAVVNLDRTRTLDMTMGRFMDQSNTLPGYAKDLPHYYDHMKAPVRVIEDGPGGQPVAVYRESGPDHYAHAENYCTVAGERSTPSTGVVATPQQVYHAERKRSSWQE